MWGVVTAFIHAISFEVTQQIRAGERIGGESPRAENLLKMYWSWSNGMSLGVFNSQQMHQVPSPSKHHPVLSFQIRKEVQKSESVFIKAVQLVNCRPKQRPIILTVVYVRNTIRLAFGNEANYTP